MGLAIFPPENLIEGKQPSVECGRPQSPGRIREDLAALESGGKSGGVFAREDDRTYAVEAHESIIGRQPHVAVACLRDRSHGGGQNAIRGFPHAQQKILFRPLGGTLVDSDVLAAQRRNREGAPQGEGRDDSGNTISQGGGMNYAKTLVQSQRERTSTNECADVGSSGKSSTKDTKCTKGHLREFCIFVCFVGQIFP